MTECEDAVYAPERQDAIAARVRARGRVAVAEVAQEFGVTQETVRRDLDHLERIGLIRRVHGGAVSTSALSTVEAGLLQRASAQAEEKERIARAALRFLPTEGGSVIIDAGSTTACLATQLPADCRLDVVTNSVTVASTLAGSSLMLRLMGGRVRSQTHACVGEETVAALQRWRVDVAFLGTNGLSPQHGGSTPDPQEAAVKHAMVAAARRVVVLADSTKMGAEYLVQFAAPEEIDAVVTDRPVDPEFASGLRAADIEVVVA